MRLIDADALVDVLMTYTWRDEDERLIDDADEKREYIKQWLPDLPTVGGWISVKDELPDSAGLGVLVNAVNRFGQDSIFIAFQGYGDFKWYTMDVTKMAGDKDNSVKEAWKITHWMPILPPKENAE